MSKDDSTGGFLSKVVKFVRHPTTSWADLDSRSLDGGESEYSKAVLKELIERKRRNDFVRRREFDMLRKIRSREVMVENGQGARPSYFQSSLPSKPDDRAMTLKKIDEIEAQMSMQWWKTKAPDSRASGVASQGSRQTLGKRPVGRSVETPSAINAAKLRLKLQYRETEPAPMVPQSAVAATDALPPSDKIPTLREVFSSQAGQGDTVLQDAASRTGLMAPSGRENEAVTTGSGERFSASHFFALDVHEIAQDPHVEEASIRFSNGEDAGAEQGLKEAIAEGGPGEGRLDDWLALFDLYRATGQLTPFEGLALDFVNRFGRSAPQWYDMPKQVAVITGNVFNPTPANAKPAWVADHDIDAHAVGTLQSVLLRTPQPWVLDWSEVQSIDVKAARALLGVFTLWGDQEVGLCLLGASRLRELLTHLTPSGRRDVEQLWWELRMAVLRVMNRPDEFELTALDFCVTYEVSPPGWETPRCQYQASGSDPTEFESLGSVVGEGMIEQVTSGYAGDSVHEGMSMAFNQLGLVELSGEIRGDPQATLENLEHRFQGSDVMIISCRHLIRVDFAAAGTLLNWVGGHHSRGRLVQFVDVHRLVSAFFHVIGITEYAKVVVRND